VEDSPVSDDQQGTFEIVDDPACQQLFNLSHRRTAFCDEQYFLLLIEKAIEKTNLLGQLSLVGFNAWPVLAFVIGEHDFSIYRKISELVQFQAPRIG
jgi:hypothetical protein